MHFKLLSEKDLKAMDALLDSYGGAGEIAQKIDEMREYNKRKEVAGNKGFGETIEKAEEYAKGFAKVEDFIEQNNIQFTFKAADLLTHRSLRHIVFDSGFCKTL